MSASFTFSGRMDGREVEGRVHEGAITGDPFVAIRARAWVEGGMPVGRGPTSGPASLTDERLARITLDVLLDGTATFDSEAPIPYSDDVQGE